MNISRFSKGKSLLQSVSALCSRFVAESFLFCAVPKLLVGATMSPQNFCAKRIPSSECYSSTQFTSRQEMLVEYASWSGTADLQH